MGFNFSHPQKSGGAMAPLAPPSERALHKNTKFRYVGRTYVAVSSFNYKRMQDNDSFKLVSMYMLRLIIFQFWKL